MDGAQQVKEKLDIAEFIRAYVPLSPAGKNLKGNCPFHKEKTPSFMVSPDRQTWHCFGCGAGGDVFAFLMRYENVEFFEALKILADKAGIDIGHSSGPDHRALNVLYEINRVAKDFFKENLTPQILEYLRSRGLKSETIAEFEIGFALDQPEGITRFLLGKGYAMDAIEKAGFSVKTERGTFRDRFRNRIMFPLINPFGKTVGFTGRIMPLPAGTPTREDGFELPKYVNSPETPIFNKSKLLYGLDKSKNFIREAKTAVLVEGQMDFIMSWQDGVKNLVATSGTAITSEHLKSLRRIADSLVLSFDNDEAGKMAAERTIDLAGASDFSVKVLFVPADLQVKDPADIAQAHPGKLAELIAASRPAMEYFFERYQAGKKIGVADWKKNIRAVLSKIKSISSAIERSHWLRQLSNLSGVGEESLMEETKGLKESGATQDKKEAEVATIPAAPQQLSRKELISQRIASLVVNNKDIYPKIVADLEHIPENYRLVIAYHHDSNSVSIKPELQELADLVSLRYGFDTGTEPPKVETELLELMRQLKLENLRTKKQELLWEIKMAEQKNDEVGLVSSLSAFDKTLKEIQTLEIRKA